MTSNSSPQASAHAPSQTRVGESHSHAPGTSPQRVLHTPLTGREPGTDDYELARTLLGREFASGRTASALLYAYRERDIDLTVSTVLTARGAATRLVITTGFTPMPAPLHDLADRHSTAPELAGNR